MSVVGVVVTPQGVARKVTVDGLHDMQQAIGGGYIEGVRTVWDDVFAYCDEDGRMKGLPPNHVATTACGAPLVGPVLFVGESDREGNDTDLPPGRQVQIAVMCILEQTHDEVMSGD